MNLLTRNYTQIADGTHKVPASKSARARRSWAWDGRLNKRPGKVKRVDPATVVLSIPTRHVFQTKTGA
jgi:hypothetical protein